MGVQALAHQPKPVAIQRSTESLSSVVFIEILDSYSFFPVFTKKVRQVLRDLRCQYVWNLGEHQRETTLCEGWLCARSHRYG